ncbi:hypothetical protein H261_09999 [Paramagnetospirillum caucaseum]|uniref:Uncharacterized protein n=1 Tax=Paramagnetospirillum caucaseum TaxID=1244869 RepID=M3ACB1_9PROT|nr:hypothetical protein [Paramagnetospirillum caucaseum]EME70129.1 hypothetical protein H261_09999 [Paramagnetospirillum caucaseum]
MVSSRENFEVQVNKGGRWATETVVPKEVEARALAKKFLADKKCEGARIVRNWMRSDGTMDETEIFAQTRAGADDGPVRISQIDEVPEKCETPEEFMGPQGRNTVNRIFRSYLDKAILTPTELMHNYKELKRLQDKDTLVPSAVDRVSQLQTKDSEQDSKSRSQEIFKSIDDISARAKRVENVKLPKLDGCFSDAIKEIRAQAGGEDVDYLAMVLLSRDLINARSWVGKLEFLCKLAVEDSDPHAVELLDGVIADVLGSAVVQEILGWQPGLGAAICRMFDLADGKFPTEKSEAGESAEILNRLFAEKKLPISRACMLDRAHRQIRSPNPLYRSESGKELEELKKLVERTMTPTGFISGSETAEALTIRYSRQIEQGGAPGRKATVNGLFRMLPDRAQGLVYLCDLAGSPWGGTATPEIAELVDYCLSARHLGDFCVRSLPPKEKMLRATLAHKIAAAAAFPPAVREKICGFIDTMLEAYLVTEQIVEKLDHQDSHLRDRAVRLVQFCAAGVLPEGKAMNRARQRILSLLRQPNFDAHFIDGFTDPVRAQKALRDFHILLVKAGFG